MASVYDVVEALQAMGLEMKALGEEADKTASKAKEAKKAAEEARSTTSGMSKDSDGATTSIGSSSLSDTRDPAAYAASMTKAIDEAARR
jgi:hypothetical protein